MEALSGLTASLLPGASFEIQVVVRVAPDANNAGVITNSVHVATDGVDPAPDNDTASVSTTVQAPAVYLSGYVYFDVNDDGVRKKGQRKSRFPWRKMFLST